MVATTVISLEVRQGCSSAIPSSRDLRQPVESNSGACHPVALAGESATINSVTGIRDDQPIIEALVVAFTMIMAQKFTNTSP